MEERGSWGMIDVEYNGMAGSILKVYAKEIPDIPAAVKKESSIKIAGRDGILYTLDGGYESTKISIEFNWIGDEEKWSERWGNIQKWLSARNCHLTLGTDPSCFYKIMKVELEDAAHTTARIGVFKADFLTLDGLRYLKEGQNEHTAEDVVFNPYEISHPIYKITGEGKCTLIVNGKQMIANVGQNLVIDTDRMIAFRKDGTLNNTAISGKYEDLFLMEGKNKILITEGFDLKVVPNWRCL